MSRATAADQVATHDEVVAQRVTLRQLAREHGLAQPRVSAAGTVIVHSDSPGYRAVRRFATAASSVVGAWVNVVTDDVPAAQVDAAAFVSRHPLQQLREVLGTLEEFVALGREQVRQRPAGPMVDPATMDLRRQSG